MPAGLITLGASDGSSWLPAGPPIDNVETKYGLQIAALGDSTYGVGTASDTSLFFAEFSDFKWTKPSKLPSKYKAAGRVAVYATDDRFYVSYRGTNDGVYLIYTTDFKAWTDLGRVGSKYAKSTVAPGLGLSLVSVSDTDDVERLVLTGVGDDKYIYYTLVDFDGKRDISWTKIPGTGTQSALTVVTYYGTAILFHTAYNNKAFFYQSFDSEEKKWSDLAKVDAPTISSGVSATYLGRVFAVAYRGTSEEGDDRVVTRFQSQKTGWSGEKTSGYGQFYQLGLGTAARGFALLSVPYNYEDKEARSYRYKTPMAMSDKGPVFSEKELMGKEWNCKWQPQNEEKEPQGLIKKFFCCS